MQYNLTEQQRDTLRRLVAAARATNRCDFTFHHNSRFVGIQLPDKQMNEVGAEDLWVMARQDLISFDEGRGRGTVCQAGMDAVDSGFARPAEAPTIGSAGVYIAGNMTGGAAQGAAGNYNTLAQTDPAALAALVAELTAALHQALPGEHADAAAREAEEIRAELSKAKPDAIAVEGRARSLWARIGTAFTNAGEFADRADKVAAVAVRYGTLLAAACHVVKEHAGG